MIFKNTDKNLPAHVRKLFDEVLNGKPRRIPVSVRVKGEGEGSAAGSGGQDANGRKLDENEELIIEGIANEITPDRGRETIAPEAWDLANYKKNPIILYEHDYKEPVGVSTQLDVKPDGLHYVGCVGRPQFAPLTETQKKVRSLVCQKILRGNSVGFLPHLIEYDEDEDVLRYTLVELLEITLCAVPMQQDSMVTSIKNWRHENMSANAKNKAEGDGTGTQGGGENGGNAVEQALKGINDKLDKLQSSVDSLCEKCTPKEGGDGEQTDEMKTVQDENKRLKDELAAAKKNLETVTAESEELLVELQKKGTIALAE